MFENLSESVNQEIDLSLFSIYNYALVIKREDLIHPEISGNKYRKLKYNLKKAQILQNNTLLTFGGAYSNHIAATAAAGKEFGFNTIGIIRGEEIVNKVADNPTLSFAEKCGMQLHFIMREDYRSKTEIYFIEKLKEKFGDFYLLPEGGTNSLAVKGCKEILINDDASFDYICASVGTGGTLAGIINASTDAQIILGFSALKGTFQNKIVQKYCSKTNWKIFDDYSLGGYAKIDLNLIRFINEFKEKTGILLDPIYTGKMLFGIFDLMRNKKIKENSRILAIHTGGLQGIAGMNLILEKKALPTITI